MLIKCRKKIIYFYVDYCSNLHCLRGSFICTNTSSHSGDINHTSLLALQVSLYYTVGVPINAQNDSSSNYSSEASSTQ